MRPIKFHLFPDFGKNADKMRTHNVKQKSQTTVKQMFEIFYWYPEPI